MRGWSTFSDVPSENSGPSTDRRTRKREARRGRLLDLAAELVERDGVDGLTMAGLAEAADYATASLYTYFPSRSALLAALQRRALATLAEVGRTAAASWDAELARHDTPADLAALAKLWSFSDLFLAAPDEHPREFRLQQQLLVSTGAEDLADAVAVVPSAMAVLELPRRLLADATALGALEPAPVVLDPVGNPIDGALMRTLAWVVALNGALMVDGLSTGLPSTGAQLGAQLTESLLAGWGAPRELLAAAEHTAAALVSPPRTRSDRADQRHHDQHDPIAGHGPTEHQP